MIVNIEDKQAPEADWIVIYLDSTAYLRIEEDKIILIGAPSFTVKRVGNAIHLLLGD
jgi:hypothetical protein